MNPWIDISVPVKNGIAQWPGDPLFSMERVLEQANGDVCTLTRLSMSAHTGTHMDAPLHFVRDGAGIEQMPPDATIGPARVICIHDAKAIRRAELVDQNIGRGERILFRTRNSDREWADKPFDEEFVFIARDAAEYLAKCGVRCVGVDYLSVGGFREDSVETHVALLGAGIWVIEGLFLGHVEAGDWELVCLPIKLVGSDGAPARAVVRRSE